jgi:hypothetical protein
MPNWDPTEDEENCPKCPDGLGHCQHWWEGEECCYCGAGAAEGPPPLRSTYR